MTRIKNPLVESLIAYVDAPEPVNEDDKLLLDTVGDTVVLTYVCSVMYPNDPYENYMSSEMLVIINNDKYKLGNEQEYAFYTGTREIDDDDLYFPDEVSGLDAFGNLYTDASTDDIDEYLTNIQRAIVALTEYMDEVNNWRAGFDPHPHVYEGVWTGYSQGDYWEYCIVPSDDLVEEFANAHPMDYTDGMQEEGWQELLADYLKECGKTLAAYWRGDVYDIVQIVSVAGGEPEVEYEGQWIGDSGIDEELERIHKERIAEYSAQPEAV